MAEDRRAAKKRRFTSNIVTLKVGSPATTITVHETLLQDNSPFFKAALEKQWKEGRTREIQLPTDRTDVLSAYIDYLYSRSLQVDRAQGGWADFDLLIALYSFGEKILDDAFCDAVMSATATGIDQRDKKGSFIYPGGSRIRDIYETTVVGSPMRRFVVDMYAQRSNGTWTSVDNLPYEFLQDLTVELFRVRSAPGPHGPIPPFVARWFKVHKAW